MKKTVDYPLTVSGIKLLIEMDRPVEMSDAFYPFLVNEENFDYKAVFKQCSSLERPSEKVLYESDCYRIHESKSGFIKRSYFDSPRNLNCYAVTEFNQNQKKIITEYADDGNQCMSSLRSIFFHTCFEKILNIEKRLWLHGSLVSTEYGGILFTGPSGIGKTTQSDLWVKYRNSRVINGDRPILSCDDGSWLSWGAPYAGSSKVYLNENCPVSTIVMLRQAKECSIRRLDKKEAFRSVWPGLTVYSWDSEFVSVASELAIQLINAIPVYELSCTPDIRAVEILEKTLRKDLNI